MGEEKETNLLHSLMQMLSAGVCLIIRRSKSPGAGFRMLQGGGREVRTRILSGRMPYCPQGTVMQTITRKIRCTSELSAYLINGLVKMDNTFFFSLS